MSYQRTTCRLLGHLHRQGRWAPFLYHERSGASLDRCLARLFRQDRVFFQLRPINDRFHAADVQRPPEILSYALLAPSVCFPCLDTIEEIDLRTTRSPGCWSL